MFQVGGKQYFAGYRTRLFEAKLLALFYNCNVYNEKEDEYIHF